MPAHLALADAQAACAACDRRGVKCPNIISHQIGGFRVCINPKKLWKPSLFGELGWLLWGGEHGSLGRVARSGVNERWGVQCGIQAAPLDGHVVQQVRQVVYLQLDML